MRLHPAEAAFHVFAVPPGQVTHLTLSGGGRPFRRTIPALKAGMAYNFDWVISDAESPENPTPQDCFQRSVTIAD